MSARGKIKRLMFRDGMHCWLCKKMMKFEGHYDDPDIASFDHYVPRSYGGRDSDNNLRLAHRKCNGGRARLFPETLIFTEEEVLTLTYPNHQFGGPSEAAMKAKVRFGVDIKEPEGYSPRAGVSSVDAD